jgi:general nucleoside transport system ATP-binding protein
VGGAAGTMTPANIEPSPTPPAIELVGIDKRFGAVHANRAVSLKIERGTIHGIIGENGAGKSTLMSILYGYYQADSGETHVNGEVKRIATPQDAIAAGIGMVHQHFMLVENLTVIENVLLGVEGGTLLAPGLARARELLARLEKDYRLEVDPDAVVGDLPVGLQQRVEILKALFRGAEVLILDEPTAVLAPQEADHLFNILRSLKAEGKTVVLITHKLREVLAVTDTITVMRQGEVAATLPTAEATRERLAELMVGRKVLLRVAKQAAQPGATVLEVEKLRVLSDTYRTLVDDVSFTVRAGEIVGIAGVAGNGQSELLEALAGILPVVSGRIRFKGRDVTADPNARTAKGMRGLGMGHVPEDRLRRGLVPVFAANESAILGFHDDARYNGPILMHRGDIIQDCERLMSSYDVRPRSAYLRTAAFSGGNQQKLVLGREIDRNPDLLLVGQPTRGVDIGAIEFIHRRLVELRDAGKAILLVSVELDEVLALSDRILVMFGGHIVGEVAGGEVDERAIGLLMTGGAGRAAA